MFYVRNISQATSAFSRYAGKMRRVAPWALRSLVALLAIACGDDDNVTAKPDAASPPPAGDGGDVVAAADTGTSNVDAALPDTGVGDAGIDTGPAYVYPYFDINHILSTGQSLSVGSQGAPLLSTTQPYANLKFNTGVVAGGSATGMTSFIPLVEGPTLETMSSGLANLITQMAEDEVFKTRPAPANTHVALVSCHGVGGIAYAGLKKGTTPYANGMMQATRGKAIAAGLGKSYVVRVVTNVHGESDHRDGNTSYKGDLVEWQKNYDTDVRAITGQTLPIPMLHTQISNWPFYGQGTSLIPMAQLEASTENPGKIILVGAKYNIPYAADGLHLNNHGYRQMGEYYAKVYRRVVLEGGTWEPVRPVSAAISGDEIKIAFKVPVPPLVLDTTLVTDPGDYGFEYTDDSATPPQIASVAIDGATGVKIKLSAVPTGPNSRVRYAMTSVPKAKAGPTTGPRGNLRDSDKTPSLHGYDLYNWAVHFEVPVP